MATAKTVLVTGGAGYIGSHATQALLEHGYDVVVLDNLSTGSRGLVPRDARFVQGNVGDESFVFALLKSNNIKDILHFAAYVDVAESMRNPQKYYDNNTTNTAALLVAAEIAGVERFIFSSTAAVYGNPTMVPVPESAPKQPISHYGHSKSRAEDSLSKHSMQYAALRYFNVAGTHFRMGLGYKIDSEPTHLIRRVVLAMHGGIDHVDVFGIDYPTRDGTAVRDYIHVRDLTKAHVDVLRYLEQGGKSDTFNVGYGKGHSVMEVIETAGNALGRPIKHEFRDRREGDSMTVVADASKLKRVVGWAPQYESLAGMILDEYDWVKSKRST